jgi:hypothetical protein
MPRQNTNIKVKNSIIAKPVISSPVIIKNNNFFNSIKEGFGFGIGSTVARNMVNSLTAKVTPTCIEYNKCLESNDKYECFANLNKNEYIECRLEN